MELHPRKLYRHKTRKAKTFSCQNLLFIRSDLNSQINHVLSYLLTIPNNQWMKKSITFEIHKVTEMSDLYDVTNI